MKAESLHRLGTRIVLRGLTRPTREKQVGDGPEELLPPKLERNYSLQNDYAGIGRKTQPGIGLRLLKS